MKKVKCDEFAMKMNSGGELISPKIHRYTKNKYKADHIMLKGLFPFILAFGCVVIDVAFFRSLFIRISYDSPIMILLEVCGMAFAADIVAIYAGILAKRIKQGLRGDKEILYMLIAVPILALIVNGVLRVATVRLMSVDGSVNAEAIALMLISIVMPIFTSVGNFAISFQTYDPLAKRMYLEESDFDEIDDYCRRLQGIIDECENFDEKEMIQMDCQYFENAKNKLINDANIRYANMKIELMKLMGDPSTTSFLSKQDDEIFNRVNQELEKIKLGSYATKSYSDDIYEKKNILNQISQHIA